MIVVIGGGIVGLSVADQLLQRGEATTVLEARTLASGASGVATSYLEPRLGTTPLRLIEQEAHRRWPDYAQQLQQDTGIDPALSTTGQIRVATEANRDALIKDVEDRRQAGWRITALSLEEACTREPALGADVVAAAHAPDVLWVDGKAVCGGLAKRIRAQGGTVHEHHRVTAILRRGANDDPVTELACENGSTFDAQTILVCCAMGHHAIKGMPTDIPDSRPVRGVNLVLDMASMDHPIRHLIKHKRGTLCPRPGHQLLVGTTYEHGEEDLKVAPDVIDFLLANAESILPTIRDLPLIVATAGLRTKVGDGNLAVGRSRKTTGVYYSLGHAGSGYLRTPVLSAATADYVISGDAGTLLTPLVRG
ncbi:MAG: FAD-dependent oxidoreductase [Pseudomonadota bacterium]